MRRTAPDVLLVARIEAMYTICSRFTICSFRTIGTGLTPSSDGTGRLGAGPFPNAVAPFEIYHWSLLSRAIIAAFQPTRKSRRGLSAVGTFFIPRRYKERAMTADECQRRAEEAKALAAQTQDLWERETYLRIATQWQLLAAHRAVKEHKPE